MMYFLGLFSDISVSIGQAIRTLFGNLSAIIYDFIVVVYDLFVTLSRAEILDSAFIQKIYEKVGLVLGLFMMFKLIFSLLQHLLDPNKFNDKKNGFASIIQRSVIAIVLLGTVPSIFRLAFDIQNFIVGDNNGNNNVIYKLIIGDSISTNVSDFGTKMASDLFFSFYKEEDGYVLDGGVSYDESGIPVFIDYDTLVDNIEGGDSFFTAVDYLAVRQNSTYVIDYNWLFSVAVGIFVVYILIMYIIQVGVRVVQLAYLQLIAPIPILSYISDPEGAFNKWIKQCISTYLDLFLRVAIIYFIVYLSSTIMNSFGNPSSVLINSLGANVSDSMIAWVKIFILIGLLLFAKKAPELIKDLFPNMGGGAGKFSFGLNPKKELNNTLAAGLIGGAVGAVGAGASNVVHGYINTRKAFKEKGVGAGFKSLGKSVFSVAGGAVGGAKAGLKTKDISNVGNAVRVANENREKRELKAKAGYHWYRPDKVIADKVMGFAGETTGAEKQIKTAEFRRDALQRSKQIQWENFARTNPRADLSLLTSMQEFEDNGKKVWKGINSVGVERTFELRGGNFIATDGGVDVRGSSAKMVSDSATIDGKIKEQNKTIKGLQTANNDAKKQ